MFDYCANLEVAMYLCDEHEDNGRSVCVSVCLICVQRSSPGFTNGPPEGSFPPHGLMFELDHFAINGVNFSWDDFVRVFGEGLTADLCEVADSEANGSGEF